MRLPRPTSIRHSAAIAVGTLVFVLTACGGGGGSTAAVAATGSSGSASAPVITQSDITLPSSVQVVTAK